MVLIRMEVMMMESDGTIRIESKRMESDGTVRVESDHKC